MKAYLGAAGIVAMVLTGVARADYLTGWEASDDAGYVAGTSFRGVDGWFSAADFPNFESTTVVSSPVHGGSQAAAIEWETGGAGMRVGNKFAAISQNVRVDVWLAFDRDEDQRAMSYFYVGEGTMADNYNFNGGAAVQIGFDYNSATSQNELYYRDGSSSRHAGAFTYGEYYHFTADIDLASDTYDLTIVGPGVNFSATDIQFRGSAVNAIGSVVFLTNVQGTRIYADDLAVTAVPEPASLALLGLGGLAMWKRR